MSTLDPLRLPLKGRQLIEASAGTGKTWTLAALYVRLVLGHGRSDTQGLMPSQILVMTFTDAAVAELRERIRARLQAAVRGFDDAIQGKSPTDEAFLWQLCQDIDPTLWPECLRRLRQAVQAMDEAAIYTIHGWSRRMLAQHALQSREPFASNHLDTPDECLRERARDHWRRWFYPLPLAHQAIVLEQLARTPEALLEHIQPIWQRLDRSPEWAQKTLNEPWPDTNAVLGAYDTWHTQQLALQNQAQAAWQPALLDRLRAAREAKQIRLPGVGQDTFQKYLTQLQAWAEHGHTIDPKVIARFSAKALQDKGWAEAAQHLFFVRVGEWLAHPAPACQQPLLMHAALSVRRDYQAWKAQQSVFDFNDLLQRLHQALRQDTGELAATIRDQYPVALVDEFQDTDVWQYESLDRVYPKDAAQDHHALIMIGDPKQAIYRFRGADLGTYLRARQDTLLQNPHACHTLDTNRRATPGLVHVINRLFARNPSPFTHGDQAIACPAMQSAANQPPLTDPQGQPLPPLTVWHLPVPEGLLDKPVWPAPLHVRTMAAGFASHMVRLLQQHPELQPGDMAVLVRGHAHAQAMQNALSQVGLPSVFLSDRHNVFQTPEALDLWRILRAIAHPHKVRWLRSAMACRLWGFTVDELTPCLHHPDLADRVAEACQGWRRIWQQQGVLPMLYQWLHSQGIVPRLLAQAQGERRLTNLLHLGELLQTAAQAGHGPQALLTHLVQQIHARPSLPEALKMRLETDAQCVQLVTFHKSKGLQYPLVFVPFLGAFQTPGKPKEDVEDEGDNDTTVEEDMRLLYVALTRAERGMWLGVAPTAQSLGLSSKPIKRSAVSVLLDRHDHTDLPARLQALLGDMPEVCLAELPPPSSQTYQPMAQPPAHRAAQVSRRKGHAKRTYTSFSSLTRHLEASPLLDDTQADAWIDADMGEPEAPDPEPTVTATDTPPAPMSALQSFPRGPRHGNLLHELLEWQAQQGWPLVQPSAAHPHTVQAWQALLQRQAQALRLPEAAQAWLPIWLEGLLRKPLPLAMSPDDTTPALVLSHLSPSQCWPEMAFQLGVADLQTQRIDAWLQDHVLPGQPRRALPPRECQGMLTGVMDLVCEHAGRYWVIDYKSNWLPGYPAAALEAAVLDKRYDLQYVLYLVALHRLLRSRLRGYDYDTHVGGAVYVFMRGMEADGAGVHRLKPPRALIESIDQAFRGNNP